MLVFAFYAEVVLGTPVYFVMREWVERAFRVEFLSTNAPCEGFITLNEVEIDGHRWRPAEYDALRRDAFDFHMQTPMEKRASAKPYLLCDHGAKASCLYTGLVPPEMVAGEKFKFFVTLQGSALDRL